MTIETLTEETARKIEAGDNPIDAIGEALSLWGLHNLQISLDRINPVLEVLEGLKTMHPFSLNSRTHAGQSVILYHHGFWVTPKLDGQPVYFEDRVAAIEWVIANGEEYSKRDIARRFSDPHSFSVYNGLTEVAR